MKNIITKNKKCINNDDSDELESDSDNSQELPLEEVEDQYLDFERVLNDEEDEKFTTARFSKFISEFKPTEEPRLLFENIPKYRYEHGPKNMPDEVTPGSIFELFFSPSIIEHIKDQSNLYRVQLTEDYPDCQMYKKESDTPITASEIYAFLACFILMGITRHPKWDDHWSKEQFLGSKVSTIMYFNDFKKVNRYLHLMNNRENDESKLFKVKFLDEIIENWREYYEPGKNLVLDETIIPFRGKSKFIVYCPRKPERYGLKAFSLCESYTGYCFEFKVYSGRTFSENLKKIHNTNFKHSINLEMTKNYWYRNHYVYLDNYYTSFELANIMLDKNCYITGTINLTNHEKNYIDRVFGKERDLDEYVFLSSSYANLIRIRNTKKQKKTAYLITSVFSDEAVRSNSNRKIPRAVKEYMANKGGVDIMNSMIARFRNLHRNLKWWKTVFAEILDISLINAWIIYKNFNPKLRHKEFRLKIIAFLASKYQKPFDKRSKYYRETKQNLKFFETQENTIIENNKNEEKIFKIKKVKKKNNSSTNNTSAISEKKLYDKPLDRRMKVHREIKKNLKKSAYHENILNDSL